MRGYSKLGHDLYSGKRSFDFVGSRWSWYAVSVVLVLAAFGVLWIKGLNLGVEFTGGEQIAISLDSSQVDQETADEVREIVAGVGVAEASAPTVVTSGSEQILVQTEPLDADETTQILEALKSELGVADRDLSPSEISASWGAEIAQRALIGIGVFLVLVLFLIWGYFREWKMSVAAIVALFHDLTLTIGIYALSGFNVTPAAVTGVLAILAFSLYDTVVVFDKVRENTKNIAQSRTTYARAANLAVNQTLVRSINTSVVALIPIGVILWVAGTGLGASSLQDLALAQFVGTAVGVYSSVFIAPRVLVHLKSSETDVRLAEKRAKARERSRADRYAHVPAAAEEDTVAPGAAAASAASAPFEEYGEPDESDVDDGRPSAAAPRREPEAMGKGRVAPEPRRPVGESRASGRSQPVRQTKKQRKKG